MKKLVYILFFLVSAAQAQDYYTNDPGRAGKLINGFLDNAEARGLEVRERLVGIDELLFVENGKNEHYHKAGKCIITVAVNLHESDWEIQWKTYHELGHHFGLQDCKLCSYNIMAFINDSIPSYFRHPAIQKLYLDLFFEQIRNPSKPHIHY